MIHYQLRCESGHEFDGWFAGSAAFDDQAARGLIECPHCGSPHVERALMAPAVVSKRGKKPAPSTHPGTHDAPATADAESEPVPGTGPIPSALMAKLQRLREKVEQNCVYVGKNFATEARKIHSGEAPHRQIYGQASPEQVESLAEDGIDIARIPWVPRADG